MKKHSLLFSLISVLALTGCNEDRFKEIPVYLRGVREIDGQSVEVAAVQFGLRRGDVFYRMRFQVFEASAKALPEVIALRFKGDNSSRLWLDFENREARDLELKASGSCADRENPRVKLCWSKDGIQLQADLADGHIEFDLKRDPGGSLRTRESSDPFTVDELVGQARFRNYSSLQEAERVFQAKERIRETRGNLLPHFNMRDLISVATDGPLGLIGTVGELLPFIFPTHWLQWSKSLEFYQAEILSFAALLGNEMNAVEEMTYAIHRDQALMKFLDQKIAELQSYNTQLQKFEERGMLHPGTTLDYQLKVRALEQDRRQMQTLVEKQFTALAHATGLRPVGPQIVLETIPLPDLQDFELPNQQLLAEKSKDRSMEIGTLHFLKRAASLNTEEKRFGFLDPASEGVIGFGYASTLRIAGSQVREIEIQIDGMKSLVEQRVSDVVSDMREAFDLYRSAQAGVAGVNQRFDQEIRLPEERGMLRWSDPKVYERLLELTRESLLYESVRLSSIHAVMIAQAKVDRLLGEGFYQGLEVVSLPKSDNP